MKVIQLNGSDYHLKFEYILKGGDTLYHGTYHLNNVQEENRYSRIRNLDIQGLMSEGKPHKVWKFRLGYFEPDRFKSLDSRDLTFSSKGKEIILNGGFEKGKKTGQWTIQEKQILHSDENQTLFEADFTYSSGGFDGKLELESESCKMVATFDEDLYPKGIWAIDYKNGIKEKLHFNDRILTAVEVAKFNKPALLTIFDHTNIPLNTEYKEMTFGQDYLQLLSFIIAKMSNNGDSSYLQFSKTNPLTDYVTKARTLSPLVNVVSKEKLPDDFRIRLPVFKITEDEKAGIERLQSESYKLASVYEEIRSNVQFRAFRDRSLPIKEKLFILDKIYHHCMHPVSTLLELHQNESLQYFQVSTLQKSKANDCDRISYEFDGKKSTYRFKNITKSDDTLSQLDRLIAFVNNLGQEMKALETDISEMIEKMENEESWVVLEAAFTEILHETRERVSAADYSQVNEIAGFYVKDQYMNFLQSLEDEAIEAEKSAQKLIQIKKLSNCLEDFIKMTNRINKIPDDFKVIDRLYTRTVFNPYTFTNMDERIHSGIFDAFQYSLLPALMGKLKVLSCKNISDHTGQYDVLFQGMVDLLKSNNRKTERSVRQTREPQKIANILGIKIDF
jgi:hypothetical protein